MKKLLKYIAGFLATILIVGTVYSASFVQGEKQLLEDGDMEAATTAAYTQVAGTVTKEAGGPYGGSQVLRIATGGATSGRARQQTSTIGKTYRVTGNARSDGTNIPAIFDYSRSVWNASTSTDWNHASNVIDFTFTAQFTQVEFRKNPQGAGHVEFDNILITEYLPPLINAEKQRYIDGDFEAAGVGAWTSGSGATLTKESGAVDDGTQVLRIALQVADNAAFADPAVANMNVAGVYRSIGKARGDGVNGFPQLFLEGIAPAWVGTTSVAWQYFDVLITSDGSSSQDELRLFSSGINGTADYCEWDDVFLTFESPPLVQGEKQIIEDGDMEAVGVASWGAAAGATLTKENNSVDDGSQVLRVTDVGSTGYATTQNTPFTIGKNYRITGYGRTDGNPGSVVRARTGTGSILWTGVNSTTFQRFDVVRNNFDATHIRLNKDSGNGNFVEFDNILATEIP